MKVLFHRYGSIVEHDILAAFDQLNIEVIKDEMEIDQKNIDPDTRVSTLAELILENRPDFVFSINFFPYISQICEKLNVIYAALSVDCPVLEIYSEAIRNKCNRIFLFDYAQYESVVNENPDGIFYLPLASNEDRWDAIDVPKDPDGRILYKYNVSFIGSLYTEKSPLRRAKLSDLNSGYIDGVLAGAGRFTDLSLVEEVLKAKPEITEFLKEGLGDIWKRFDIGPAVIDVDEYVAIMQVLGFELTARDRISLLRSIASLQSNSAFIGDKSRYLKDADDSLLSIFTRSDAGDISGSVSIHGGVSTHDEMPRIF